MTKRPAVFLVGGGDTLYLGDNLAVFSELSAVPLTLAQVEDAGRLAVADPDSSAAVPGFTSDLRLEPGVLFPLLTALDISAG